MLKARKSVGEARVQTKRKVLPSHSHTLQCTSQIAGKKKKKLIDPNKGNEGEGGSIRQKTYTGKNPKQNNRHSIPFFVKELVTAPTTLLRTW